MPSRVSRKSSLSPSATRGSSAIDLGKDSGINLGKKTQPSVTTGGIGITQEVANIGGVSVTGGVSVEVSPLRLNVSGQPDFEDPNKNAISISGSAELPGGILGVSGGGTINTNTGEITGASIGGEVIGLGINISASNEGDVGVEFTIQIPGTPIELSLGLGFPKKEEDLPTPTPTPTPLTPPTTPGILPDAPYPDFKPNCKYWIKETQKNFSRLKNTQTVVASEGGYESPDWYEQYATSIPVDCEITKVDARVNYYIRHNNQTYTQVLNISDANEVDCINGFYVVRTKTGRLIFQYVDRYLVSYVRAITGYNAQGATIYGEWQLAGTDKYELKAICPEPSPSSPLPFPNPPPRRQNVNECCRDTMRMLRRIHKHLGVSPLLGMEPLEQFAGVKSKGENFQGEKMAFPFEVPKTWLDVMAKKNDKITVKNLAELLLVMGAQSERLERVLGTKEFIKDSEGKLRQSEGNLLSWLSGKNPDFAYPDPNDFWLNTDDGVINEKRLEVRSLTDAVRYTVEAINRLERILPIAELKDSSIPKRWIYPGAKGQERVGNLIHLIELMVRSDDKHRGYWPVKVKVKDADPAIEGDQPVELEFHSQADVFRELFQYLIDMEGDGDLTSNFALRSAFQTCQMHQLTVQNNAMLDAIVEYLDFKIIKTKASVPMPFNPFAGMSSEISDNVLAALGFTEGLPMTPKIDSNKEADIEALAPNVLQNTMVAVDIVECDEKKTLNEALLELLKHSSAASAAVSERVSESAIDRVIAGAGLAQKVASFLLRKDVANALGIGDLDKWIDAAELGYTDSPESQSLRFPESDPLEPYGRPTTQNPRIREIDTKEPKAD
ncbi:hypothetical protein [Microcoleus sp. S13_C5]|uniref:hypothetical protein n=1 Tax=Microcoleus sp. S13_C5 TaxID=3055411 RepID=UPI002FCEA41B